jgi:hypothetical protein
MSKYIQPTISFKANSHTAGTLPGPMSWALSLSISDQLTVDLVEQRTIETIAGTGSAAQSSSAELIASHKILDGHDVMTATSGGNVWTPATVGCYIFLRNNSSTTNENIYISIVALGGSDDPTGPAGPDANTTGPTETANTTLRTFTLLPGEFAWFPFDYTGDIYCEAATGTPQLEYWRFDKG